MTKRAFVGFAGFGGVDIALREAGYDVVGVELGDEIAAVARANGHNTITADILDIDPRNYAGWDLMHFSPPCPNFSLAKVGREESETDLALARKIVQFIEAQPEIFTLENVYRYRNSQSWTMIAEALRRMGYGFDYWNLNSADYGVSQTRRRMIVIARRDGELVRKPTPTHRDPSKGCAFQMTMLDRLPPWRGWYAAIEDLIPTLPDSNFAEWQLKRLPEELVDSMLVMTGNTNLIETDAVSGRGWLEKKRPANTVSTVSNGSMPRAFLVSDIDGTIRESEKPSTTVLAKENGGNVPRAYLLGQGERSTPIADDAPAQTRRPARALVQGRVVSMTPRALARFQDFPDSYELPDKNALACKGIGNAVPVGLYQAVLRSI